MSSKIETTFIDLNLMSGSVDNFRATFGGYWEVEEDEGITCQETTSLDLELTNRIITYAKHKGYNI